MASQNAAIVLTSTETGRPRAHKSDHDVSMHGLPGMASAGAGAEGEDVDIGFEMQRQKLCSSVTGEMEVHSCQDYTQQWNIYRHTQTQCIFFFSLAMCSTFRVPAPATL